MAALLRGGGLRGELLRGAGGSIGVAAAARLLSLGSAVILARVLGPSSYGVFAFAFAAVQLLQIPATFGMRQLVSRELASAEAVDRWDLARGLLRRAVQLVTIATALVVAVTLALLWLGPLQVSAQSRLTLTAAVGFLVVLAYADLASASLRGLRRVVVAQMPMEVGRPALFLAGVVGLWLLARGHLGPATAMAANAAAAAVMLAVLAALSLRTFRGRRAEVAPRYEMRRWLASAFPFALIGGLGVVNTRTDIVMLGMLATTHDVGIYRVAVAGAGLIPMVLGAVNMAVGPTMAALHSRGDGARLARVVRLTALAGLAGGLVTLLVFLVWGHGIIRGVFGAAYVLAWAPLIVLSLGQTANVGMGPNGMVLNMTGHEKDALLGLVVAAVVNVGLNAVLIPPMGTLGAATATAVSTLSWNVIMVWRVKVQLGFWPFGVGRRA